MDIRERQKQFKKAIQKDPDYTAATKYTENFGVSNSAKIIEGGLFTCNVNLNIPPKQNDQIVFACLLTFPPQDEVYFAVFVRKEFGSILQRLKDMIQSTKGAGQEETEETTEGQEEAEHEDDAKIVFTDNNKNTKFYLADDGRLYMRNKDYWYSMNFDRSAATPAPIVDKIV